MEAPARPMTSVPGTAPSPSPSALGPMAGIGRAAFVSPEPRAGPVTSRELLQRTLSDGGKRQQKRKLHGALQLAPAPRGDRDDATSTPPLIKRTKKKLALGDTPNGEAKKTPRPMPPPKPRRRPEDKPPATSDSATRKLAFPATPSRQPESGAAKPTTSSPSTVSSSSSDGDSSSSEDNSSSDECEVSFDAITLGNMRIVREAISPASTVSTASSTSMQPIGLEYRFSVASTVSSIAVAPNGKFLVVGFYNGTIYLYPLTRDSLRFRKGVLLDHISARGMYTQLMVRVALPDDGRFIFAGVYRGSTEIRAFEVDSIELPSSETKSSRAKALFTKDSDDEEDGDDEDEDDMGLPTAHAVTHMYSDAKLKGFSAVKNVVRKSTGQLEYHLLCGLGIKNIHLWRFFHDAKNNWAWECIFDKQSNGISIELLSFHRNIPHQFISKSEHQNIRIWHLEEDSSSSTLKKKSHVDVKQTVDTTAIYGDYAYGGGESLALIDLRSTARMELDLPLSAKEMAAQVDAQSSRASATRTRITASMRGRRGSRRGGPVDDGGSCQRHMRTVSQVASQDDAPFIVGMCTDGSVFMHEPHHESTGLATPLQYVEGYEEFFQDPSLSFQAQFSDLTRVNTSGQLAVLPLPETEHERWMIVAANAEQLLVRSLKAFIHHNEHKKERVAVRRGLRRALREMGQSSSDSESDDDDSGCDGEAEPEQPTSTKPDFTASQQVKNVRSVEEKDIEKSFTKAPSGEANITEKAVKLERRESPPSITKVKPTDVPKETQVAATLATKCDQPKLAKSLSHTSSVGAKTKQVSTKPKSNAKPVDPTTPVTNERVLLPPIDRSSAANQPAGVVTPTRTPVASQRQKSKDVVPSPVVSISSPSSASSNPNTPERIKRLPDGERRALVLKELDWTPVHSVQKVSSPPIKPQNVRESASASTSTAMTDVDPPARRSKPAKKSATKTRTKATQALFTGDGDDDNKENADGNVVPMKRPSEEASDPHEPSKKRKVDDDKPATVETTSAEVFPSAKLDSLPVIPAVEDDDMCTDVEECGDEPQVTFVTTPYPADGHLLLAGTMFQYDDGATVGSSLPAPTRAISLVELNALSHVAQQVERLKASYRHDRERIMRQHLAHSCDCGAVKKKGSSAVKLNWRKQIAGEAARKKHMKRRHKRQLAARLKELLRSYEERSRDLLLRHRLELQGLSARMELETMIQATTN